MKADNGIANKNKPSIFNRIKSFIIKNSVPSFIISTYFITWIIWLPLVVWGDGWIKTIGIFGPSISAFAITAIIKGKEGVYNLFKKILIWKVRIWWYLFSLLSTYIVVVIALNIFRLTGGEVTNTNDPGKWYLIPLIFIYVLLFSVAGEEFGWRGFLLPRLQSKYSALTSSIIIGLIWGVWHLPLFLISGDFHQNIPFLLFVAQDIALAVILTWIYNNTRGSLLLVHIFHAASNTTVGLLPLLPSDSSGNLTPLYITVSVLIIVSIAIVIIYGPKKLSKKPIDITTL